MEYWERPQQLADRCAREGALSYVPQGAHQRFLIEAWLFLGKNFPSPPLAGNPRHAVFPGILPSC